MGSADAGSDGAERASGAQEPPRRGDNDSLDETLPSGEHMVDSATRAVLRVAAGTPTSHPPLDPEARAALNAAAGTPGGFRPMSSAAPTPIPAAIAIPNEPPATPLAVAPGATIGRYLVERQLGSGTMGLVLAAIDPALDRKVALKVVRPDQIGGSTAGRQRLLREAQAMAKLAHPNVVTV